MKQVLNFAPTFNPAAKTLDFTGYTDFDIGRLYAVINVTSDAPIYVVGKASLGASVAGSILTLDYDTTAHSAADDLMVIYDTLNEAASETTLAALSAMSSEIKTLNETMLLFTTAILAKMPMLDTGQRVRTSIDSGTLPNVTTVGTLTTLTTAANLTNLNNFAGGNTANIPYNLSAGAFHLYSNINIS